ncbi:hypothetical protein P9265_21160 [Schinkia azotoformans]|uniref:hypothetical protein n=1 Tax=Schinkia azotoformans TaxID=1454 RepID=UPI002E1CD58D|nr:hypothetical protein [Schinkia azotoformans]
MIETIDFLDNFSPKGHVKVELFDDLTGRKVDGKSKHNYISNYAKKNFFKYLMYGGFTYKRAVNPQSYYDATNPFERMLLTTANHPENPDEFEYKGDVIGYASTKTAYSGSSPQIGTINTSESYINHGRCHFVFDFATNVAIGTFQSIYFVPEDFRLTSNSVSSLSNSITHLEIKDNFIYTVHSSGVFRKYDKYFNLVQEWTAAKIVKTNNPEPSGFTTFNSPNFTIQDEYIYYSDTSNGYRVNGNYPTQILRASLSDPLTAQWVTTFYDSNYKSYPPITFDRKRNLFYRTNGLSQLLIYDVNFNLLKTFSIGSNNGDLIVYGDLFTTSRDHYNINTGTDGLPEFQKMNLTSAFDLVQQSYTSIVGFDDDFCYMQYTSSGTRIHCVPNVFVGSRCLLPEPVTKTNAQTMKITYDFILPS